MKVGFAGLGNLGAAMARRLAERGVDLTVWNRTRSRAEAMALPVAESPADLMARVDVVFVNVFDSPAAEAVLGALLAGGAAGKAIVDTTTNRVEAVVRFHRLASSAGARYLECPVLGSVIPASRGELTILAAGDETVLSDVRPFLDHLARSVVFLGAPGAATVMKLVNNLVLGAVMGAIAEGTVLGERAGLPRERVIEVLAAGAGNSYVMTAKKDKLLREDYAAHFSVDCLHKDLGYALELGTSARSPLFLGSILREMYALAVRRGLGGDDFSAVTRALEEA
jgi:3-hydroxyisobutyrate dehydrogenase